MRIAEILPALSVEDREKLAQQFNVAATDLVTHLCQEPIFAQNYRAISRRLRQILEYAYTTSLEYTFNDFRQQGNVTRSDLKSLQERALIFVIPALAQPEKIVIPEEYLFFADVPLKSPLNLVAAFRLYRNTRLHRIARYYQTDPTQPFISLAANLYYQIRNKISHQLTNLSPEEIEILQFITQYGNQASLERFRKYYYQQNKTFFAYQRFTIEDLLGLRQLGELNPLQKLFVKCLLVPILTDQALTIEALAIPDELFDQVAATFLQARTQKKLALMQKMVHPTPRIPVQNRETVLMMDLKKILLLTENIQPRATQTGYPFKADCKHILQILNFNQDYLFFLFEYAIWLGIIQIEDNYFRTTPDCQKFFALPLSTRQLLAFKFLKSYKADTQLETDPNDVLIQQFLLHLLKTLRQDFITTSYLYDYAGLEPDFRGLYEDFQAYPHIFEKKAVQSLQHYYWLGLIEADENLTHIHLSEAGHYVLGGRIYRAPKPDPEEDKFTIQPNYEIIAVANLRFELLLQLARIATITSIDLTIRFRLHRNQLVSAAQNGMNINTIYQFLQTHSKTPLPQIVEYLLKELEQKEGEISLVPVTGFLQFNDPQVFEQVKLILKDYCLDVDLSQKILIKPEVNLNQLEQLIRRKGYFLKSFRNARPGTTAKYQRLTEHLETLETPPVNSDELTFANPANERSDVQKLLQFAIQHQLKVRMEYRNESLATSVRKIEPHRLDENILEAYCYSLEMARAFRVDRIIRVELLG
ncbi:helicase C-terminal domain-containing protein [candidate division KSB1 bacterium]|nr:helicase C-terminal domain-containing protein [candidate division KSB1 bacterium]